MARRPTPWHARWTLVPTALLLSVALGLAACGASVPSTARGRAGAGTLALESVAALSSVRFVELNGSITSGSGTKAASSISVTNVISGHGTSEGTVDVAGNPSGQKGDRFTGRVRYVVANHLTWVDGSNEFWTTLLSTAGASHSQVSSLLKKLAGHWIELIAASTSVFNTATAGLIDPRGFAQQFLHASAGQFSNEGDVSVNGKHVVELATSKGAVADLAPTGSALPVAIRTKAPSQVGTSLQYAYPSSVSIAPPKHFEYLETILKPYLKH